MFQFIPHASRLVRLAKLHGMPVALYVGILGEVLVTGYVILCHLYGTGDVAFLAQVFGAGRLVDLDTLTSKYWTVDGLNITLRMVINYFVGSAFCVYCGTPALVAFCKWSLPAFAWLFSPLGKLTQKRRTVAPAPSAAEPLSTVNLLSEGAARKR